MTTDWQRPRSSIKQPNIILHTATLLEWLLAIATLLILLFTFRYNAFLAINSKLVGGVDGDVALYHWLIRTNLGSLINLNWFNTPAFYPYGSSLAWSDNFILPALFVNGLTSIGISFTLAFNLLILGAELLIGIFTFRLAFALTEDLLASLFAGSLFMGYPYFSEHLGHPQLQFAFWIPLICMELLKFLATPTYLRSFNVGLVVFLSFLTGIYYSIFVGVVISLFIVSTIIARPSFISWKNSQRFLVGSILGLIPAVPFVLPYLSVQSVFGTRKLYEAYYFSSPFLGYLSAPATNLLYGGSSILSASESHLFPGLILLVLPCIYIIINFMQSRFRFVSCVFILAIIAAALLRSATDLGLYGRYLAAFFIWVTFLFIFFFIYLCRQTEKGPIDPINSNWIQGIFILTGIIFFILSLGPLGNPEKGELALAPYRIFYEIFPGLGSIRAISRFGIVAIFSLSIISAIFAARHLTGSKTRQVLFLLLWGLGIVECLTPIYPLEAEIKVPFIYEDLRSLDGSPGAFVALPFTKELDQGGLVKSWGNYAIYNARYMNWSAKTNRYLVNGYSGQRSKLMIELPAKTANFPDDRSISALRRIGGLRYIVYHSSLVPNFNREEFHKRFNIASGDLSLINEDRDGNFLFELKGEDEIGADFYMIAPNYGFLTTSLRVMGRDLPSEIELKVHFEGEANTSFRAVVHTDGRLETLRIPLVGGDPIRPSLFKFTSLPNARIFLGQTLFEPK